MPAPTPLRPVAVVDGCRTPFCRSGTELQELPAVELARLAVAGLLHRSRVDPAAVERLVLGTVLPDPTAPNPAREVVFGTGLPHSCAAYTVSEACVSSLQAFLDLAMAVQTGQIEAGIAAGAESLSDVPLRYRRPLRQRLIATQKARGALDYLKLLRGLRPADLLPERLAIAERTTRETMGENAERLAKSMGIRREEQDAFAYESHRRAAWAAQQGLLARQIVPVYPAPSYRPCRADNGVRADTSLEKLAALKPAFDRNFGTVTAGNSSFLTDGAAAVLLMTPATAESLGLAPLAHLRAATLVGMEPYEELLLGPALATARLLEQTGLRLDEIGVLELHEAFAAQVLAVLRRLEAGSPGLGRADRGRVNAWGGSLSVGHPFGATGARLILTCAQRLRAEKARYGLVAACAAGALGIAVLLENPEHS